MTNQNQQLKIPPGMQAKLEEFRKRMWIVKLAEAFLAGIFGLILSYLVVFVLDRLGDTSASLRIGILIGGTLGLALFVPFMFHRWVWRQRQLENVARVLRHKFPRLGDQLLGIVELAKDQSEQQRSATLVKAAMEQVDEVAKKRDFSDAVPNPRNRQWGWAAGVIGVLAGAALLVVPPAAWNAMARWAMPWRDIDRYTFAMIDDLPDEMVVPYAERFSINAKLQEDTKWSPDSGVAKFETQPEIEAKLTDGNYTFDMPPQKETGKVAVSIGDVRKKMNVQPLPRPELKTMIAKVALPEYLQRKDPVEHDVRSGSVTLVKGSNASFEANASRELAKAEFDGLPASVSGSKVITPPFDILESIEKEIVWFDKHGLSAKKPFVLKINSREDEPPSLMCDNIASAQVIMEEEVLSFEVFANDDFGVKMLGMAWEGLKDDVHNPEPAKGEKIVMSGSPESDSISAAATFSAKREGISPQVVQLRLFAEDYFPDRGRIYSPAYTLYVLSAEDHAIWLTRQFRKWFRQSQEVYEREQQLYETNKQLRDLPSDQIDMPETRRQIETQAAAERANGRRLGALTRSGEQLIGLAMKNDQFNVATLESWAAMLNSLKDISQNRMPSVADLLKQSANAQPGQSGQGQPGQPGDAQQTSPNGSNQDPNQKPPSQSNGKTPPQVGENRDGRTGKGGQEEDDSKKDDKTIPSIIDVESGFNELDDEEEQEDQPKQPSSGGLKLPSTVVQGGGLKQEPSDQPPPPAQQKMQEAVKVQEDLLAEFAKIADELKKILGNLEGSTFVKRLKAASRKQLDVASALNKTLSGSFGLAALNVADQQKDLTKTIADQEIVQSETIYTIQQDLEAYFNRVQQGKFRGVFQEMKEVEVVAKVKQVADTIGTNWNGQSIADTEYWSDTLDRWAEQLVGPG